jgi:DNA-binding LacI/PurR family transcriptional regulator
MGREAVRLALGRIQEPNRPQQTIRIATQFVIRESTGPVPNM